MTNTDQIKTIASEFKGDEKKLLEKLADEKMPEFSSKKEFKEKLDAKIQNQISITKEQKASQAAIDAIPTKLKWRFYLTGYGYAIVSFVALFLIIFCTNIFTGTLKVPTKYTYLDEDEAFGNLKNQKLAYDYNTSKASNFSYYDDVEIADDEALEEDSTDYNIRSTISTMDVVAKTTDTGGGDIFSPNYSLNKGFMFNDTYRFAYKDRIFPKIATEYPILKSSGILMGSNTPNQVLKNLKIGGVSFKKFQDLEIAGLYIEQKTKNGYTISYDSHSQTLNFYPNNSRQAQEFKGELPTNKQIIKAVEKDLKQLGISTKNYSSAEVDIESYDEIMGIVNIFYPLNIQGKEVRDPEMNEQIGMDIAYDLNLKKVISVVGTDIATYDISDYPTLTKSYIEKEIEKGGNYFHQGALHEESTVILFDNMQIVYIPKNENGIIYYVPAIKGEVDTSLESYKGPKYVFQEIVQ